MKKILIALCFFASAVQASEVKELVSPYAPGGVVSTFGRIVQKYLVEEMKVDTVLVNKPGADARIGVKYVASQPANGNHWIVASTGPFLFNQVVYNDPGYRVTDFDLVLPMAQSPSIIAVSNQSGITNLTDFIKQAKTRPLNCGVSNSGALFLTKFLINKLNLTNVEIISYKGASEVSTALIGGTLDCSVDTLQSQLKYHTDKRLKIIAVSSNTLNASVPEAKLFSTVIPNFSFYSWYGVGVLKSTPVKDKALILAALKDVNRNEKYRQAIEAIGLELGDSTVDAQEFIKNEYVKFEKIRQQAKIPKID